MRPFGRGRKEEGIRRHNSSCRVFILQMNSIFSVHGKLRRILSERLVDLLCCFRLDDEDAMESVLPMEIPLQVRGTLRRRLLAFKMEVVTMSSTGWLLEYWHTIIQTSQALRYMLPVVIILLLLSKSF